MGLIKISSCPVTKLTRKCFFDFLWSQRQERVAIRCYVSHYDKNDRHMNLDSVRDYVKDLVASDALVLKSTGRKISDEEKAVEGFDPKSTIYCTEYAYYSQVVVKQPIKLEDLIESMILLRDSEGKLEPSAR